MPVSTYIWHGLLEVWNEVIVVCGYEYCLSSNLIYLSFHLKEQRAKLNL